MELVNTRFGTINFEEKDLIQIADGLVGMPDMTRFLILDFEEETPFKWMQSADDASLGFLIADPVLFNPDFNLVLGEVDLRDLEVNSPADLAIFVICTFRGEWAETTGNLMGPIIVQVEKRMGRQVIVEDSSYSTHEPVHDPVLKAEAAKADGGSSEATKNDMSAVAHEESDSELLRENMG